MPSSENRLGVTRWALTNSGSPPAVSVKVRSPTSAKPSNERLCLRHSRKCHAATGRAGPKLAHLGTTSCTATNRSASGQESGRSNTPLKTVKMAVLAPMPRASVRIATTAKPGLRINVRSAYRMSNHILLKTAQLEKRSQSCVTIREDTKPDASPDPEGKPFGTNLRAGRPAAADPGNGAAGARRDRDLHSSQKRRLNQQFQTGRPGGGRGHRAGSGESADGDRRRCGGSRDGRRSRAALRGRRVRDAAAPIHRTRGRGRPACDHGARRERGQRPGNSGRSGPDQRDFARGNRRWPVGRRAE